TLLILYLDLILLFAETAGAARCARARIRIRIRIRPPGTFSCTLEKGRGASSLRVADGRLRLGPPIQEPLPVLAAQLPQDVALPPGLDALADRVDPEGAGQRQDRA